VEIKDCSGNAVMISVIVPVLDEEKSIAGLLTQLAELEGDCEILLADGGSTDGTLEAARDALPKNARFLACPRGRAAQCNAAAQEAQGDILFFLHADSRVTPDVLLSIRLAVDGGALWGCLSLRFDDPHPLMTVCAWLSNLRARRGIVFGDQGIFIRRSLFWEIGAFPELPLMEDYEFSLRLRRKGIFPIQLRRPIVTSARRFRECGRLRAMFLMWRLRRLYRKGHDVAAVAALYRQIR
jgi:rSAM/selenodomain-associated transferase 2